MSFRIALPVLSALGFGFALVSIARGDRPPVAAEPVADPSRPPYARFVAGAGLVEPATRAIGVGSPMSRVVREVAVVVGQRVQAGDPLFVLDGRDLSAELELRRAELATARARLARLEALPREEDVLPAIARVSESEARSEDARNRLALVEGLDDPRAVSRQDLDGRRYESRAAEARLAEARAELDRIGAGAWEPDLAVARAQVDTASAAVDAVTVELQRLVVQSPIAGTVLKLDVRPGEFAPAGALAVPLVTVGDVSRLHVRVDIDENDAWRFRPGARAHGSVRGNRALSTELRFEYAEPHVIPKRSLTGDAVERVDTRVLQVVFGFDPSVLAVHVGQQMDVYVEVDGAVAPAVAAEVVR